MNKCSLSQEDFDRKMKEIRKPLFEFHKRVSRAKVKFRGSVAKIQLLEEFLKPYGFKLLGYGVFRGVFALRYKPDVIFKIDIQFPDGRINRSEKRYLSYISPKNKRYFAKIYYISDDFNVMVCERLEPFSAKEKYENYVKILKLAKTKRWALEDIHPGNVMCRKTKCRKVPVLCDYQSPSSLERVSYFWT